MSRLLRRGGFVAVALGLVLLLAACSQSRSPEPTSPEIEAVAASYIRALALRDFESIPVSSDSRDREARDIFGDQPVKLGDLETLSIKKLDEDASLTAGDEDAFGGSWDVVFRTVADPSGETTVSVGVRLLHGKLYAGPAYPVDGSGPEIER